MITAELNQLLQKKRIVSKTDLGILEKEWQGLKTPMQWEDFLVDKKAVTEDQLLKVKSEEFGVETVDLHDQQITEALLNYVPEPIARRHKVISFAKNKNELSLAMVDPTDLQTKEFIKKKTGLDIKVFLIGKSSLDFGLSKYHNNLEGEIKHMVAEGKKDPGALPEPGELNDDLKKQAEEIPIVRVVDTLLEYAVIEKASDIHIEPQENSVVVRYRIDGVLHDVMTLPKAIQAALVARIKVLANLKIDEHRMPQDGRYKIEKDGYKFSLRISTIPIFDGEKVVMRLLDESSRALSLEALGFLQSQLDIVNRNIHKPHGMMLITGPTGSGKSTSLYAILTILNTKQVNISTIEDPVEYRIAGANQMQVNPKIGLTFAMGLRALLRQDPNIIMIGEIRDQETAEESMHAAMTGHIVLSTLHTNSASAAPPRLIDIGIEPYLIASTLNAIMAQRLVRMICPDCKTEKPVDADIAKSLQKQFNLDALMEVLQKLELANGAKSFEDLKFYEGAGCEKCNKTGYKGRIGVHEIMENTPQIEELIVKRATSQDIEKQAVAQGMITMWQDGFIKAVAGQTTIEEILRVTKE
ncbi:type II/IV secretion system protein [bacterium]|nr:MAG: type II/IV secretion system protein [bacterium]